MERNSSGSSSARTSEKSSGRCSGSARAAPPGGIRWELLPALCLALTLSLLLPARALPLSPGNELRIAQGLNRSGDLLKAANASLSRLKELGILGFDCTFEEVDLEDITKNQINTIKACTAEEKPGNCPVLEGSTLDMSKCLQGIYEDLSAYRAELKNFDDLKVLTSIDKMMEALDSSSGNIPHPPAGVSPLSFREQMRLCSILQAFHVRSVTISRMMNYLSSL